MLRNIRNIRNIFSFRGVRFALPLQGVSRFATPLHKGWGKSGFLGIISVSVATVGF